ncbi:uncharacterized protein LOC126883050 [Diabrotica virgifera virgifera]|uniref:Uncharacterized protein n=1 Tax=Diabrotica virgifera virgifera TaxID=50390 RepID=A0ABM5K1Y5_DIAVI|nr:uncharacterized protein LOC126883050 [Diabrotica virgifera virgifera]
MSMPAFCVSSKSHPNSSLSATNNLHHRAIIQHSQTCEDLDKEYDVEQSSKWAMPVICTQKKNKRK